MKYKVGKYYKNKYFYWKCKAIDGHKVLSEWHIDFTCKNKFSDTTKKDSNDYMSRIDDDDVEISYSEIEHLIPDEFKENKEITYEIY